MSRFAERPHCYVIAEAGSNHDGRYAQAEALIDAAAEAGADAVKFQMFKAAQLYTRGAGRSEYLGREESIYDIIEAMEMPPEWLPGLARLAEEADLDFLVSAFDETSLALVDPFVPVHKCASYEMTHLPLVRAMAKTGKPLIMSTGTADLVEVANSLGAAEAAGASEVVLLQCTAAYPTPPSQVNVRAMTELRRLGVAVGLSDHSRDPEVAPCAAVALGARVVEKHFTLSNRLSGPDHAFAVEPDELRRMVSRIRQTEQVLGHGRKEVLKVEEELRSFARRSIFTTRSVAPGETLGPDNLAILRCGTKHPGLSPSEWETVLGKPAAHELPAGRGLRRDDVAA